MIPKFRAWDKHGQKMFANDELIIWNGNVYANDSKKLTCNNLKGWSIDDEYLMQSTGLFDRNGKEIFEGDIVKRDGIKRPEVVKFGEWIDVDTLGFKEQYIGFYFESEYEGQKRLYSVESKFNNLCKVIGNIYENPELLEEKDEKRK